MAVLSYAESANTSKGLVLSLDVVLILISSITLMKALLSYSFPGEMMIVRGNPSQLTQAWIFIPFLFL